MAAMIQIFTLVAKEGQLEEAQKEVARAKEIYEGRGATSARVFWAIEAGEQSGNVTLAVEYPSAAAWAAVVDSDDDEMNRVRQHLANRAGPVQILGTSLLREVDIEAVTAS